jgi:hypothetical protein
VKGNTLRYPPPLSPHCYPPPLSHHRYPPPLPRSTWKCLKATATIDAPPLEVFTLLTTAPRLTEVDAMLSSARVIKSVLGQPLDWHDVGATSASESLSLNGARLLCADVCHNIAKAVFPTSARDFVILCTGGFSFAFSFAFSCAFVCVCFFDAFRCMNFVCISLLFSFAFRCVKFICFE